MKDFSTKETRLGQHYRKMAGSKERAVLCFVALGIFLLIGLVVSWLSGMFGYAALA